jgi:hypothetical protein
MKKDSGMIFMYDKLISIQKIEPIIEELTQTRIFLVNLDIICLILFQF